MRLLLAAVALSVPVLITPKLLFHYDSVPKVALVAFAAAIIAMRPAVPARNALRLWRTRAGKALCGVAMVQVIWTGIATARSSDLLFSLLGSGWRRFGLLTMVSLAIVVVSAAAHLYRKPGDELYILRATAVAAIFVSLYTVAQYFGIDPFQNAAAYRAQDGDFTIVRPPATLGHADYAGWWLAIAMFCSWGLSRTETGSWRLAAIAATAASGIAAVLSGTRSALLAILAGLAFLLITRNERLTRRRSLGACGLVAIAALFYISPAGEGVRARVRWSSDEAPGGARPLLWRDSLRMAINRPFTGFGPETFAARFPQFQSEDLSRLAPDFYHESPHNAALDALTSEGAPGLLLSIAWLAIGLTAAFRPREKQSPMRAALSAALVASFIASVFNSLTIGPAVATGLVIAMLVARQAESSQPDDRKVAQPRRWALGARGGTPVGRELRPGLLAAAIPVASALAAFGTFLVYSDYRLGIFERVSGGHDPAAAMAAYRSLPVFPGAPAEDIYCSRRLACVCMSGTNAVTRLECSLLATRAAARATTTADNPPNAWYNLAMFAAAHNDARGAEKALRTAIQAAPNWFRPHLALANYLELRGRGDDARAQMRRAIRLERGENVSGTSAITGAITGTARAR